MIDWRDQRRLDLIESQLRSEDPELDRCFSQWRPPASPATVAVARSIIVLSTLGVLAGLTLTSPLLLVVSGVALTYGWIWLCWCTGRRT